MISRLGNLTHDHPSKVILVWLLVVVLLKLIAPSWSSVAMDGDLEYLPADTTTARAAQLNAQAFPEERAKSQIVLVFVRSEGELTAEDRQFALDLGRLLEQQSDLPIVDVITEKDDIFGTMLKSRSGQAQRVIVGLHNGFMATDNVRVLDSVLQLVNNARKEAPEGLQIGITGSAAVGGDMLAAAAQSVRNTHLTTILLVVVVLMAIYRSVWLVVVPLITIGICTTLSFDLLALLAQFSREHPHLWPTIRVFTTTKIFIIVLLFGAGTDYCLFLIARFREQLAAGLERREAIATSLRYVGVALAGSALTTIVGLAMMGWAKFGKFAYSGPAIAVGLAVTLLACVTLVPAMLSIRKREAEPAQLSENLERSLGHRFWQRLATIVLNRPGTILFASLLLASPLAWVGSNTQVTYDLLGELAPERTSRQGTELLRRHFPVGEIGPLVVLAQHPQGDFDSVDGLLQISYLAKPLDDLPGIVQVRSLYQPTGRPPGSTQVFSRAGLQDLAARGNPLTKAIFVSQAGKLSGKVTRLFLTLASQPFSAEGVATCNEVQNVLDKLSQDPDSPWFGATFEMAGPTAGIRDLQRITLADRRRIQWLVAGAVLLVIVILLGRPLVCCYLIGTVLLSYLVTLGLTSLVFEAIRGDSYVGLNWKLPLFLFVLLVAVGQDYNIYLVSRVLEEQRRLGLRKGLRRALVQTGGIITSCGIIMAATFISMTTGSLRSMVELGFALSLGILLDAFLVRTILVPAFLALVARRSREQPAG